MIDVKKIRADFPILSRMMHKHPLVYLDNAATSQKPQAVIDAESNYYEYYNANVHRGVHQLSVEATDAYEETRRKVKVLLNAHDASEIIFVRGVTEAVNLVAQSYGRSFLTAGDEIIISAMEHHSNIVPWQLLRDQIGIVLKIIPMNEAGELDLDAYAALITPKTKLVAVAHISNALGTVNPIKFMIDLAHQHQVPVLIDGAQASGHMAIDVQALDCDFYTFSGHKMYAPTGIGVLYAKAEHLEKMPPYHGGGEMILTVSFEKTTFNKGAAKFEAGTPNISGVVGLGAAIDYLNALGFSDIHEHEAALLTYATQKALQCKDLRLIGTAREKSGVLSFVMDDIHPHDIGTILDQEGIAVRTGHHCSMPVMTFFKVPATVRASFAFYNTFEEIDALFKGLDRVREVFA